MHAPDAKVRYAAEQRVIQQLTNDRSLQLGVFIATAEGRQLTNRQIFSMQNASEVIATLREALARFGPVNPRRVRPTCQEADRGAGVRPDRPLRLALCVSRADGG